jgi:hypothetical protein
MSDTANQAIQILGALAILAAFGLSQARVLDQKSVPYLVLNLVGGLFLFVAALNEGQWGFVMLEVAWVGVSAWGIFGRLKTPAT